MRSQDETLADAVRSRVRRRDGDSEPAPPGRHDEGRSRDGTPSSTIGATSVHQPCGLRYAPSRSVTSRSSLRAGSLREAVERRVQAVPEAGAVSRQGCLRREFEHQGCALEADGQGGRPDGQAVPRQGRVRHSSNRRDRLYEGAKVRRGTRADRSRWALDARARQERASLNGQSPRERHPQPS